MVYSDAIRGARDRMCKINFFARDAGIFEFQISRLEVHSRARAGDNDIAKIAVNFSFFFVGMYIYVRYCVKKQ